MLNTSWGWSLFKVEVGMLWKYHSIVHIFCQKFSLNPAAFSPTTLNCSGCDSVDKWRFPWVEPVKNENIGHHSSKHINLIMKTSPDLLHALWVCKTLVSTFKKLAWGLVHTMVNTFFFSPFWPSVNTETPLFEDALPRGLMKRHFRVGLWKLRYSKTIMYF